MSDIHPDWIDHVILDALGNLQTAIDSGEEPWEAYTPNETDGFPTRETYMAALHAADAMVTGHLSARKD